MASTRTKQPTRDDAGSSESELNDDDEDSDQFFEASEEASTATSVSALATPSMGRAALGALGQNDDPDDSDMSLQAGVDLAQRAVWLFLDSDFEQIEALLHTKRHTLLYASEGYAAIQYLRAMLTFTREAMGSAQKAAEDTIGLSAHYRKPRGVGALLQSGPASRAASPAAASNGNSGKSGWLDSPRLSLRAKKKKGKQAETTELASTPGSFASMDAAAPDSPSTPGSFGNLSDANLSDANDDSSERLAQPPLPPSRSWAAGLTGVADSLLGIVRAGSQAVGLGKPDWHALRAMTATQRHAELVHAEAYLMRAVLNVASGDGVMAVLREGWHVRAAYATYRGCYAYIQDAGSSVDADFVSGTYLGMGVFNLVLSMLPARLLRVVELVGFKADRALGLELLAVAAGWRSDAAIAPLMRPPTVAGVRACGAGLRSEFCSLVLQGYHVFLCSDLFLGYANLPLVDAVLRRAMAQHPRGLVFMYFDGRLLMARTRLDAAIGRFAELVRMGKGAVKDMNLRVEGTPPAAASLLIDELSALDLASTNSASTNADSATTNTTNNWRQLQYLGYWERSLCFMALGRWIEAAEGFNTLRKENNWNKGVYTYALAACVWEHSLTLANGDDSHRLLSIVCLLMEAVPLLKRKVAGKSIPVEKFVIRKASKFQQQDQFLLRPGLELLHVWNLYSKMPHARLLILRDEVDAEIARLPSKQAYRHQFYYDDLAVLLITKGCVLRELAHPTFASSTDTKQESVLEDGVPLPSLPELAPLAADSFLRLLRLVPLIERDHYLGVLARFQLGNLYLSSHEATDWARTHWKCILSGKPLTSPPFLTTDEYQSHVEKMSALTSDSKEEDILQESEHSSLAFYDKPHVQISDWCYSPPYWSDSKKYSLENMIQVRTFNADNRLKESLLASD